MKGWLRVDSEDVESDEGAALRVGAARRGVCPIASTQVSGFSLRAAQDGDALVKLGAAAADTGAIRVAPQAPAWSTSTTSRSRARSTDQRI